MLPRFSAFQILDWLCLLWSNYWHLYLSKYSYWKDFSMLIRVNVGKQFEYCFISSEYDTVYSPLAYLVFTISSTIPSILEDNRSLLLISSNLFKKILNLTILHYEIYAYILILNINFL